MTHRNAYTYIRNTHVHGRTHNQKEQDRLSAQGPPTVANATIGAHWAPARRCQAGGARPELAPRAMEAVRPKSFNSPQLEGPFRTGRLETTPSERGLVSNPPCSEGNLQGWGEFQDVYPSLELSRLARPSWTNPPTANRPNGCVRNRLGHLTGG